jgi:hypothetical protein
MVDTELVLLQTDVSAMANSVLCTALLELCIPGDKDPKSTVCYPFPWLGLVGWSHLKKKALWRKSEEEIWMLGEGVAKQISGTIIGT